MAYVEGWTELGQQRRHGKKAKWWCRVNNYGEVLDGPLWTPLRSVDLTDPGDDDDELLG